MTYQHKKEPLYRKVNTKTRMVRHNSGIDFRHIRNTKEQKEAEDFGVTRYSMISNIKRGLDYTPLFKFLLSKVGKDFVTTHSEALSRIDKEDPIFWLIAKTEDDKQEVVRVDENTYYSGLYVDDNGLIQKVNPEFDDTQRLIYCTCCTFSFNGVPIKKKVNKEKIID